MTDRTKVDMGDMLALLIRIQQEQTKVTSAPQFTAPQRRLVTDRLAKVFLRLLAIGKIDLACEIGAHEGTFARNAKRQMPNVRVVAFEANPVIFDRHRRALEELGVEYYPLCVTDRAATTKIRVPVSENRLSQSPEGAGSLERDDSRETGPRTEMMATMGSTLDFTAASKFELFECETVSLDGFLSGFEFERGALWVDVEGAASLVFEGAVGTLCNCVAIYVELESQEKWSGQKIDAEVYGFLLDQGFVPVLADVQKSWQYNVVLLRPDFLALAPVKRTILNFLAATSPAPP